MNSEDYANYLNTRVYLIFLTWNKLEPWLGKLKEKQTHIY